MGQLLTKTVFLHKMSHIQLNYVFLLFRSIFGLVHWKLLFLVQKVTISESSKEILRKFVFLNKFEKGQIQEENLDFFKQLFLDQTSKRGQMLTKTVFLLKISHIQLNYVFLLFWSIFGESSLKTSLFSPKNDYLRKKQRNTQKVCFS